MSHKSKVPLVDQVLPTLNSMLAIGRSKYSDSNMNGLDVLKGTQSF